MSPYRRNVIVGVTVIGALVVLGWMMLKFGSAPAKLFQNGERLHVTFKCDRADGLAEGAQVTYRGVSVGQITHMARDINQRDVVINTDLENSPPLPANVEGIIRTTSLISGNSTLSLELLNNATGPLGALTSGETLPAHYVGADLIPPQFADLALELQRTTRDLRDARLVAHLDETVRNATQVLKSLQDYVADPVIRENVQTSISNFRLLTESANRSAARIEKFSDNLEKISNDASATLSDARATIHQTQGNLDQVTRQLNDRLLQTGKLLDTFQSIAGKIDQGHGTAGLLINDPKLYQSLLDNSKALNAMVTDLQRLVEQWEQEGLYLKLK